MKINRRQFLKALPAAALALTACGSGQQEAPATTDALVLDHAYPLDYARQFTADVYTDGSVLLTIAESGDKFLVRPEGAAELSVLPEGTVELRQPLENIYLVSSSMMDYFIHLDALDSIALSGTRADGWYLDEAKAAMEAGEITYAGKYSAPDYECILAAHCSLAIENTMIYHTPEVKEQLEHFGVPVLVERSSYESGPLARMEWIKFIGLLLGRAEEAERVFSEKIARIEPVLQQEPTGKTVAFFSVTGNNLITVRKGGDYVAQIDRDGRRQLCLCRPHGQWQQPFHHESPAGNILRPGQRRRCTHLQQHHRGRGGYPGAAGEKMRHAGRFQSRPVR